MWVLLKCIIIAFEVQNATPNLCWVFCANNKGGFFEIAFVSTDICLALRRLLTFCLHFDALTHVVIRVSSAFIFQTFAEVCYLSLWSVHISRVCWRSTIDLCLLNLSRRSTPWVKFYLGLSPPVHIFIMSRHWKRTYFRSLLKVYYRCVSVESSKAFNTLHAPGGCMHQWNRVV